MKTVDEDTARIFAELTELGLGTAPAAKTWRHLMSVDLSFFRSETSQRLRAEGRTEGRVESHAEDILLVLGERGIDVPDEVHARITSCTDLEILRAWLKRSLTAATAEDLFVDTKA
ncbi:hypothetical protein [Streptomyces montanus]|uniref:hypothetical protein n=1 Tax=Streptomyces montanus TaxID=2580423 RepID=UPI00319DF20F